MFECGLIVIFCNGWVRALCVFWLSAAQYFNEPTEQLGVSVLFSAPLRFASLDASCIGVRYFFIGKPFEHADEAISFVVLVYGSGDSRFKAA
jgi:hypothetical protein